jgi:Uma2 family endonuclease
MKSAAALTERSYTVAEYFEFERNSEERYEYYNGKLIKMPGELLPNITIAQNCLVNLRFSLKNRNCMVYHHVAKLKVNATKYRYSDVMVTCEKEPDNRIVQFPSLIIEVLSEGTQKADRNEKLTEYRQIPTLNYYILIEAETIKVEIYSKEGQKWHYDSFENIEQTIVLPLLNTALPLKDIYENIIFSGEQKSDSAF